MSLPDFLIAGVPKAGTTALHAALVPHPGLFLPAVKEPRFFLSAGPRRPSAAPATCRPTRSTSGAPRSTRRCSTPRRPAPGSARPPPFYLYDLAAHARIKALIPSARLIILLRDPVDRAHSNWTHRWNAGLEPEAGFLTASRENVNRHVVEDNGVNSLLRAGGTFGHRFPVPLRLAARGPLLTLLHRERGNRPVTTPQERAELLPLFADDIALLQDVTGERYDDWLAVDRLHRGRRAAR